MKILVLGGYGAVGAGISADLRSRGHDVIAAGRDATRADQVVDVADRDGYRRAVAGLDVVVNAAGAEDPTPAWIAAEERAAFVDISATTSYLDAVERLRPQAPILLSVGLAPGLTNLLAAAVNADAAGPIDIALLLGAGERHGAASTAWTYALLGRRFEDAASGGWVRNFSRPRTFRLPTGVRRRLYRADFSDQHVLTRDLKVPVRTFFGLDSRVATAALALLTWVPGASRAPQGLHVPGSDRWLALAVARDGTTRWAAGRGQSHATAVMTAHAVEVAAAAPPGVHHLHQLMTLDDVPTGRGIRVGPVENPHADGGRGQHVGPLLGRRPK